MKLRVLVQYGLIWLIGLSLVYGLWTVAKALGHSELQDFRVYYFAVTDFWKQINPYQVSHSLFAFIYPPSALVLLWPITWFQLETAEAVWSLLSLGALAGSLAIIVKNLQLKSHVYWWYFACLAATFWLFPVKFTFGMGQINLIILLLMIAAWWAEQNQKSFWAGVLLGCAAALKLFPLILVGAWTAQKRWLSAAVTLTVFVLLHLPALWWFSPSVLSDFYVTQLQGLPRLGNAAYYNQSFTGVLARAHIPNDWGNVVLLLTETFIVGGLFWLSFNTHTLEKSWLVLSLWLSGWLLVGGLAWQHHFVWAIPGLIFSTRFYWKQQNFGAIGWVVCAAALIGTNFRTPNPDMFCWWLVGSHVFWGNLLLFSLLFRATSTGVGPAIFSVTGRHVNHYTTRP